MTDDQLARLKTLLDQRLAAASSFTTFAGFLEANGIDVLPALHLKGTKLNGISFIFAGEKIKGSALGNKYSAAELLKRGLRYDRDGDRAAIARCMKREATRSFGVPDEPDRFDAVTALITPKPVGTPRPPIAALAVGVDPKRRAFERTLKAIRSQVRVMGAGPFQISFKRQPREDQKESGMRHETWDLDALLAEDRVTNLRRLNGQANTSTSG